MILTHRPELTLALSRSNRQFQNLTRSSYSYSTEYYRYICSIYTLLRQFLYIRDGDKYNENTSNSNLHSPWESLDVNKIYSLLDEYIRTGSTIEIDLLSLLKMHLYSYLHSYIFNIYPRLTYFRVNYNVYNSSDLQ